MIMSDVKIARAWIPELIERRSLLFFHAISVRLIELSTKLQRGSKPQEEEQDVHKELPND